MEETNYSRATTITQASPDTTGTQTPVIESGAEKSGSPTEKSIMNSPVSSNSAEEGFVDTPQSKKTYLQKMRLFEADAFTKKNELLGMVMRPLIYMTFPVVAYAGFSYGSNLVSWTTISS